MYICCMAKKKNIITIDLDVWTTQKEKAKELGITAEGVNHRIRRTLNGTCKSPIESWHIPELNLTLVKK